MIIETLAASLLPVGVEGIKQGLSHLFGGVKALTVDDQVKLDQNEITRIEALAKLDTPIGKPSQWVVDLRASSRYIGALCLIGTGIGALLSPSLDTNTKALTIEAANIAFGFLFGSRIVASFKK